MDKFKTERGFNGFEFEDRYGIKCSIQNSSLASENAIWFGTNGHLDNPAKILTKDKGWVEYPLPEGILIPSRMHLTQEQVKHLLPVLQYFVEHGCLPEDANEVE